MVVGEVYVIVVSWANLGVLNIKRTDISEAVQLNLKQSPSRSTIVTFSPF